MTTISTTLRLLMRRQHSVVSAAQLELCGISRAQRRTLLAEGHLEVIHRGVYIASSAERTLRARCVAACLANPNVAVCGTTLGRLGDVRKMKGDDVHVLTRGAAVELDGVVCHRTNLLDPIDIVERPDGIRHVSWRRNAFVLADQVDDDDLESVIEQLLHRGWTTVPDLFAIGRSLKRSGRDGTCRFERVLSKRPLWAKPKHSDHEVVLLRELRKRGVLLVPQYELLLPDGSTIRLDGGDPSRKFGVEVDHVTWHGGRVQGTHDKWRDRQAARIGWDVKRVTDDDVTGRLWATVNELVEIHRARPVA
jgi:hypothetical protein